MRIKTTKNDYKVIGAYEKDGFVNLVVEDNNMEMILVPFPDVDLSDHFLPMLQSSGKEDLAILAGVFRGKASKRFHNTNVGRMFRYNNKPMERLNLDNVKHFLIISTMLYQVL